MASKYLASGLTVAITIVLAFPPKASLRSIVSLDDRKGICDVGTVSLPGVFEGVLLPTRRLEGVRVDEPPPLLLPLPPFVVVLEVVVVSS